MGEVWLFWVRKPNVYMKEVEVGKTFPAIWKKTLDMDIYEAEHTQTQLQLPIVQSPDSSLYHPLDGSTPEKVDYNDYIYAA